MASTLAPTVDRQPLFNYTGGRWLWNESEQLSRRRVHFDVEELMRVTARSLGSEKCIEIEKLSEGNFNKTFLLTTDNGKQAVARVPNPNAGRLHYSTASEVATMDFVRNVLGIPAPKILAWSSRRDDNPVQAEYIIMEKVTGKELSHVWDTLSGKQKYSIVQQIVQFEQKFASTRFAAFGSIYYADDLSPGESSRSAHLYTDANGPLTNSKFAVGPTNNRMYFDDGRSDVAIDRGPWESVLDYAIASARREIACIEKFPKFPRPQGMHGGPRQFQPSAARKLAALNDYLQIAPYLLPKNQNLHASVLWHSDLHTDNIFVDPSDPVKIIGIIDWQSVHLSPLFLQARTPALLEFNGPLPESFEIKLPADYDTLSPEEQAKAQKLRSTQSLYKLYEVACFKSNHDAYQAVQTRNTLGAQITGLVGSLFSDGEPYVQGLLISVPHNWGKLVQGTIHENSSCPLNYSYDSQEEQQVELEKWTQSVELMDEFLREVGAYGGWDGWVCHADYDAMKSKLHDVRRRFLDRESRSSEEREQWMRVFPFQDTMK
ncbi:Phosphotransferase enzyme [Onygenales sp. PD_12]|nr:Phosphotransferase enzyme [Onygenales sp. PD_12]KAK2796410.1 Phosphotransferase enzyme [Onygenales sp. PD_10]